MLWVGIPRNSYEFQALLDLNLEFLGISGFLEHKLLQLGIPEFPVRIYRENSHLLFLGIPKNS